MHAALRFLVALATCIAGWVLVVPLGATSAEASVRRPDWSLYGVDMTPVGTARQVERLRRARRPMP